MPSRKGAPWPPRTSAGSPGAFIPVSEDIGMIEAAAAGTLTLDKLEAMTCVCSVGLDMIAVPGDTPATTLAAIIADECAIGMINRKTTAVRIIPAPGKGSGISWNSAACWAEPPSCPYTGSPATPSSGAGVGSRLQSRH